jgi:FtsP/CotA-like multicopper oxidase with cupredoxin domain
VSRNARILAIVGTLVVLVIAFVVLSPGDDSKDKTASTTTASPPPAGSTTPVTAEPAPPPAAPKPTFTTITVRGGKPVGGIKRITVTKGDRARIEVTSPDTSDEIHLHGYDLKRDLKAGGSVRFSFEASTDGIYEIELEGAGVQIASLVVEPN